MRSIKFRAWQPHSSLHRKPGMYEVESLYFYDDQEGHGEAFFKGEKSSEYLSDIELMQYTGLKDRNGKEIYEGDIVKGSERVSLDDFGSEWELEEGRPFEVKHEISNNTSVSGFDFRSYDFETLEVIGNIHENKELLK